MCEIILIRLDYPENNFRGMVKFRFDIKKVEKLITVVDEDAPTAKDFYILHLFTEKDGSREEE